MHEAEESSLHIDCTPSIIIKYYSTLTEAPFRSQMEWGITKVIDHIQVQQGGVLLIVNDGLHALYSQTHIIPDLNMAVKHKDKAGISRVYL